MWNNHVPEVNLSCRVLEVVLNAMLRVMSPVAPFLSEELYQRLLWRLSRSVTSICLAPFPTNQEVSFCSRIFKTKNKDLSLLLSSAVKTETSVIELHWHTYLVKALLKEIHENCK